MRNGVIAASLWALLAGSAAPAAPAGDVLPEPAAVAPDVWLIPGSFRPRRQPDGNTVMVQTGKRDWLVMDTGRHAWQRDAILKFVRERNGRIVAIVNSHWHLDHVSGNPALKVAFPGAVVYASSAIDGALTGFLATSAAGAREMLASGKLPDETAEDVPNDLETTRNGAALRPDSPVTASRTLKLGARSLRLELAPDAATAGDVWLWDAKSATVVAGDLVTLPAPFLDTACPEGWRRALSRVSAMPFQRVIPGHGPVMDRAAFETWRAAYGGFIDCAKSARPAAECAAAWAEGASSFLATARSRAQAHDMAGYYVDLLRKHGTKSPDCRSA